MSFLKSLVCGYKMETRFALAITLLVAVVAGTDRIIKVNDKFGPNHRGNFHPALTCDEGKHITGVRIKTVSDSDITKAKINGIEMICQDGKKLGPVEDKLGAWKEWEFCDGQQTKNTQMKVIAFNLRYDKRGATQIKMKCSNNVEIGPLGFDTGEWGTFDFSGCPATSSFCGYAASVTRGAIERVKFLCCSKAAAPLTGNGDWIPFGQDICIGTRDESYGFTKMPAAGLLTAMKFVHVDGSVTCHEHINRRQLESNFGCNFDSKHQQTLKRSFSIFVTVTDNKQILPDEGNIRNPRSASLYYYVPGKDARIAKEFELHAASPKYINESDEIRIWYGEDFHNRGDHDNGDKQVCVNVYGKFA